MSRLRVFVASHKFCSAIVTQNVTKFQVKNVSHLASQSTTFQNRRRFSTSETSSAAERFYTKKHEWVALAEDENANIGIVGISNYAQEALGDVVFVQLPEIDIQVVKGEECGALESVKAASELFSPVSGTVTDKNEALEKAPSLINSSPYEEGWIFKVKLNDSRELDTLMNEETYEAYLKEVQDH